MDTIKIYQNTILGSVKPMHAVNNGPVRSHEQRRNFETFRELDIPYVRNHDASLSEAYGGAHIVDVHCIFTDFSKDVDDESSYDFTLTDLYTKTILDAGSEVFYRLGSSIEHKPKKYGTLVPPDFLKWAKICEHIIMHYNEGWADGFHYDIKYWEIWNEPDLDPDDAENKRTWAGTKKQFFDLYNVAASYLKDRFPELKIGGPAISGNLQYAEEFLAQLKAPLDFFSYHRYAYIPDFIAETGKKVKRLLDKYGYTSAECILNEWNYVKDWNKPLEYLKVIKSIKGAAFSAAVMCIAQKSGVIDMLMYYDARIEKIFNGLYDSDTLEPLKTYYAFKMFSILYKFGNEVRCDCSAENIYAISAINNDQKAAVLISYFTDAEEASERTILFDGEKPIEKAGLYLLDKDTDCKITKKVRTGDEITIAPNTVILILEQ